MLFHLQENELLNSCKQFLRRLGHIPEGYEDMIFKSVSHEDFQINAARLETWCHLPDTYSPIIDILRDVIELKKLNNSLMKPTLLDDLIADTYAMLYRTVVPELAAKASGDESRERMRVDHLLMNTVDTVATPPPVAGTTPDAGAVRQRAKGVGRRDIQRKAEAAVAKTSAISETSRMLSTTDRSTLQHPTQGLMTPKDDPGKEDLQGLGSSVPGSVHDSADDESELSEIDEEPAEPQPPPAMFPNLVNGNAGHESIVDESEGLKRESPEPPLQDTGNDDEAKSGDS